MNILIHKFIDKMYLVIIGFVIFISNSTWIANTSSIGKESHWKIEFFKPVIDSLLKRKADTSFVYNLIYDKKTQFDEKFIKINILGYLQKPNYSKLYNQRSIEKAADFIDDNLNLFNNADSIYGVEKEYIAAILWLETKFGKTTGNYYLPSIFFSAAMANQDVFIRMNKNDLKQNYPLDSLTYDSLFKKIVARSVKKSNWAINEILAMEKMYKEHQIDINRIPVVHKKQRRQME